MYGEIEKKKKETETPANFLYWTSTIPLDNTNDLWMRVIQPGRS